MLHGIGEAENLGMCWNILNYCSSLVEYLFSPSLPIKRYQLKYRAENDSLRVEGNDC